jgi:hypothetical protein
MLIVEGSNKVSWVLLFIGVRGVASFGPAWPHRLANRQRRSKENKSREPDRWTGGRLRWLREYAGWKRQQFSTTRNAFATAAGAGVDYRLTDHIARKPFQVEYVTSQFNGTNGIGTHQNEVRYSAGVV